MSDRSNGQIVYYKVMAAESGVSDSEAESHRVENGTALALDDLKRWTEYKIWVLAGTSVGDGPSSYPILVRTREDGKHAAPSAPALYPPTTRNIHYTYIHIYARAHTHTHRDGKKLIFNSFNPVREEGGGSYLVEMTITRHTKLEHNVGNE